MKVDEKTVTQVALGIFDGAQPDAGTDWDIDDAVDFVLQHMEMGDFDWRSREPRPKFSSLDDGLEKVVRKALRQHY